VSEGVGFIRIVVRVTVTHLRVGFPQQLLNLAWLQIVKSPLAVLRFPNPDFSPAFEAKRLRWHCRQGLRLRQAEGVSSEIRRCRPMERNEAGSAISVVVAESW